MFSAYELFRFCEKKKVEKIDYKKKLRHMFSAYEIFRFCEKKIEKN